MGPPMCIPRPSTLPGVDQHSSLSGRATHCYDCRSGRSQTDARCSRLKLPCWPPELLASAGREPVGLSSGAMHCIASPPNAPHNRQGSVCIVHWFGYAKRTGKTPRNGNWPLLRKIHGGDLGYATKSVGYATGYISKIGICYWICYKACGLCC